MAEEIGNKTVYSLKDVTNSIEKTIASRYTTAFWVRCEMNKLNYYRQSGHCYPDLVEKEQGVLIAEMKGILWKKDYQLISRKYLKIIGEPLRDGIIILVQVKVTFNATRGMALQILDIDPVFALGELELEKKRTIEKLQAENLFSKNKSRSLALLPKRIAVLSVETSKGYADFTKTLQQNEGRFRLFHLLFPTLLQGDKAAENMIFQLRRIKRVVHHFDAVAIIRGGGGEVGLSCYNDYLLAREIADFTLPVLTGIGHSTNETVSEMVAYHNAMTPTALAEFLLQKFEQFYQPLKEAERLVAAVSLKMIKDEKQKINASGKYFRSVTRNLLDRNTGEVNSIGRIIKREVSLFLREQHNIQEKKSNDLKEYSLQLLNDKERQLYDDVVLMQRDLRTVLLRAEHMVIQAKNNLHVVVDSSFKRDKNVLDLLENTAKHLDPVNVLKRGFSYTLINGELIRSVEQVKMGDQLETVVADGKIASTVISGRS